MFNYKVWVCNEILDEDAEKLAGEVGISALLAKVFLSRGIEDTDYIKRFLNPTTADFHDPFLMKDLDKAVDRIIEALENRERIVIYGDYDVDGITSTSVLYDFLASQGADVQFYIPDRIDEGYGLSVTAIDKVLKQDAKLIITVDCGVTAFDEVKYVCENNVDIIITDHHECKESLPEALAVVNPCREDCNYPFKELAGVGVVFKLVMALCMKMGLGDVYNNYLDLVALGTIADVVPLIDENRIIVRFGLKKIEGTTNLGLKALIGNSGLKDKPINSWSISFVIAPRVNAAGRIGDAGRAVKMFTTVNENEAVDISLKLNEENKYRQDTESEIMRQVVALVEAEVDLERDKVIVVSGGDWHHGIIGIVASKITEKYYRPCILIASEDGLGKGSGRSIEGFNLFKALSHCEDLLERYGGHELAAGLTLKIENISAFREKINSYAREILSEKDLVPRVRIDVNITKDDINLASIKELEMLAPFGAGNPPPTFACRNFKVNDKRTVGDDRHLKLKLEEKGFYIDAIGFNMGGMVNTLTGSDVLDVACSLEINLWNSVERPQLNLKDIRPCEEIVIENEFFYSFDRSFRLEYENELYTIERYSDRVEQLKNGVEGILEIADLGKRVAVLVNSLESVKLLEKTFRKYTLGIKKIYKVCYTNLDDSDIGMIQVVVNPSIDEMDFSAVDAVVFYGNWAGKGYLYKLIEAAGLQRSLSKVDLNASSYNYDALVPERRDLKAVYQYVKMNSSGNLEIENLAVLARSIAFSYKINLNYYKLKKCFEIFNQLNLLKIRQYGKYGMYVEVLDTGGEKTNLENSSLYRKLHELKRQELKVL